MNFSKLMVVSMALSSLTFGVFDPTWDRPVLHAQDMKISNATFGFNKLNRVDMTLLQKDGSITPTGITVHLVSLDNERDVQLVVNSVTKDSCGSTIISANLPATANPEDFARFHVSLTDHSTRLCEDFRPFRWEARVSEGYGFCGTMDARMTVVGNPEPIYTIADVQ